MKEQDYLRNELNSRIMLTYSHSHTTMTFVISVWSILITLISVIFKTFPTHYIEISFIAPIIIFITLAYMFFASCKYKENAIQIAKISTYFACFYNFLGLPCDDNNAWELATMDMECNDKYFGKRKQDALPRMNGEYLFFAIASCTITVVLFVVFFSYYIGSGNVFHLIIYCAENVVIIVVSIFMAINIRKNTSLKKYHEHRVSMFISWVTYAIDKKYVTKEEVIEKYSLLDSEILDKLKNINIEKA